MTGGNGFGITFGHGLVQIAGVLDVEEGRMLLEEGADRLGFPMGLAVHPEEIEPDQAREIVRRLSLGRRGILITYLETAVEILDLCRAVGLRGVQLHEEIRLTEISRLRAADPELFIMKSLVVRESNASQLLDLLRAYQPFVDAFITDTYDPETSACGATGKTHDWDVSRRLVERSCRPVILAGGLMPGNVREAIARACPAGVDAHTGLEGSDGRKGRSLVRGFINEARRGFSAANPAVLNRMD
jgi:phosphoribosylanthranilate isomerase